MRILFALPGAVLAMTLVDRAPAADGQTVITLGIDFASDLVQPEHIPNIRSHSTTVITLDRGGQVTETTQATAGSYRREFHGEGKLGAARTGRYGPQVWHVQSQDTLTRTGEFPQNIRTMTITISGQSCRLSVTDRLKPGFKLYTFPRTSTGEIGYFTNYRVVGTTCSIR
jgi:hypothetical protein